jgi:hypothetical protein
MQLGKIAIATMLILAGFQRTAECGKFTVKNNSSSTVWVCVINWEANKNRWHAQGFYSVNPRSTRIFTSLTDELRVRMYKGTSIANPIRPSSGNYPQFSYASDNSNAFNLYEYNNVGIVGATYYDYFRNGRFIGSYSSMNRIPGATVRDGWYKYPTGGRGLTLNVN